MGDPTKSHTSLHTMEELLDTLIPIFLYSILSNMITLIRKLLTGLNSMLVKPSLLLEETILEELEISNILKNIPEVLILSILKIPTEKLSAQDLVMYLLSPKEKILGYPLNKVKDVIIPLSKKEKEKDLFD